MFLFLCIVGFAVVGLIALAAVPALRLTFLNLSLFVGGAIPGALLFSFVYGRILGKNQLSDTTFVGIFPVLLVGGVLGGLVLVSLKVRLTK
jgi:hypothetical protein